MPGRRICGDKPTRSTIRRHCRCHRESRLICERKPWTVGGSFADKHVNVCILYEMRSEEHTSELQSLMRISYAVFCLKKKKKEKYRVRHKSLEKITFN